MAAATIRLEGGVVDVKGVPLAGVSITVFGGDTTLGTAKTDKSGAFSCDLSPADQDPLRVLFTFGGFDSAWVLSLSPGSSHRFTKVLYALGNSPEREEYRLDAYSAAIAAYGVDSEQSRSAFKSLKESRRGPVRDSLTVVKTVEVPREPKEVAVMRTALTEYFRVHNAGDAMGANAKLTKFLAELAVVAKVDEDALRKAMKADFPGVPDSRDPERFR